MQHKGPDDLDSLSSSLVTAWGGEEKQKKWLQWKHDIIEQTKELFLNNVSFKDLFKFIAKGRNDIAWDLNQDQKESLGILRDPHKIGNYETSITDHERYRDFYPYLMYQFGAIPGKTNETLLLNLIYGFDDSAFGVTTKKINAANLADITFYSPFSDTLITYTSLAGISATTQSDNNIFYVKIFHTILRNTYDTIFQILESLNNELHEKELSEGERIEIIKEMAWHTSHAMFCQRGSAAITEIMLSGLCKACNIDYEEWKFATPPDLIALFSTSPKQFSQHFSLNPRQEMIDAVNDLINNNIQFKLAIKLKAVLEGQPVTFNNEEKKVFSDKSTSLGELIFFYKKRGILVEKLLGLPPIELTKKVSAAKSKAASPLVLDVEEKKDVKEKKKHPFSFSFGDKKKPKEVESEKKNDFRQKK